MALLQILMLSIPNVDTRKNRHKRVYRSESNRFIEINLLRNAKITYLYDHSESEYFNIVYTSCYTF